MRTVVDRDEIPQMALDVKAQWLISSRLSLPPTTVALSLASLMLTLPWTASIAKFAVISGYCCRPMDSARIDLDVSCDNGER